MLKVTTSWDDGDVLDIKLATLLSKYNIKGTFYLSEKYREKSLSADEIISIAKFHEIGGHTTSHPDLRKLDAQGKKEEMLSNKLWLEKILGKKVAMFCYPKGLFDDEATRVAKEIGFTGARTTKLGDISLTTSFNMDTTLQVYPFPFRKIDGKKYYLGKLLQPYMQRAPALHTLGVPASSMYSWLSVAKKTFDIAHKKGEAFHLWGHSWEIEKFNMWDDLESLLVYIANRNDCEYLANSDLVKK